MKKTKEKYISLQKEIDKTMESLEAELCHFKTPEGKIYMVAIAELDNFLGMIKKALWDIYSKKLE